MTDRPSGGFKNLTTAGMDAYRERKAEIPVEKRKVKDRNRWLGLLFVVIGFAAPTLIPGFPWWAGGLALIVGGHIVAGDEVKAALDAVVATLQAVKDLIPGKKP